MAEPGQVKQILIQENASGSQMGWEDFRKGEHARITCNSVSKSRISSTTTSVFTPPLMLTQLQHDSNTSLCSATIQNVHSQSHFDAADQNLPLKSSSVNSYLELGLRNTPLMPRWSGIKVVTWHPGQTKFGFKKGGNDEGVRERGIWGGLIQMPREKKSVIDMSDLPRHGQHFLVHLAISSYPRECNWS